MSMGLVKVIGKQYTPLPATYIGGEMRMRFSEPGVPTELDMMMAGEQCLDGNGVPLYLLRRELKTADNSCTLRRGKDTGYPYKWQYIDGSAFSSGVNDLNPNETYNHFLYGTTRAFIGVSAPLADDDADFEFVKGADDFEMKPYYYRSSAELSVDPEMGISPGSAFKQGISPQWWQLTTNVQEAQLNYDFAYCFDLEWAESLVPGEKVRCVQRQVIYNVPAVDEYNQPVYEIIYDGFGNPVLDGFGEPVLAADGLGNPIRAMEQQIFQYYEIIPPQEYKTAIDGQPKVELYTGIDDSITLFGAGVEQDVPITLLRREDVYVRPEDITTPDCELVYASLRDNKASADVVNPLAVISDLQTDRNGHLTKRLRALFYKTDKMKRKYPMLFEVDALPYGYCIEVGNIQHYYGTKHDQCSPYYLREEYSVVRVDRSKGQQGKTLQLAGTKCFKHRLQVPVMVK